MYREPTYRGNPSIAHELVSAESLRVMTFAVGWFGFSIGSTGFDLDGQT
jgi:hypothetical protein